MTNARETYQGHESLARAGAHGGEASTQSPWTTLLDVDTYQRLADSMAEQTGLRVSYETVRRVLAAGGIVLSRPQHKVSSPDPEYLVKKDA